VEGELRAGELRAVHHSGGSRYQFSRMLVHGAGRPASCALVAPVFPRRCQCHSQCQGDPQCQSRPQRLAYSKPENKVSLGFVELMAQVIRDVNLKGILQIAEGVVTARCAS
jgi:hypothetical protein